MGDGTEFSNLDGINVLISCLVRSYFSDVGVRGDSGNDGCRSRDMDSSCRNVEYRPIHLYHVTVVVDQLVIDGEELVMD